MKPIELALAALKSSDKPVYRRVAREFGLSETTLRRRHKGQQTSRAENASTNKKLLSTAQEPVLVRHIKDLSRRGMCLSPRVVRNLVEELVEHPIGKHLVDRFLKRYSTGLKSLYLKGLDHSRKIAENVAYWTLYYETFGLFYLYSRAKTNIID